MLTDHIDRTQTFLDSISRLDKQLKAAENQQMFYINRMLELRKAGKPIQKNMPT